MKKSAQRVLMATIRGCTRRRRQSQYRYETDRGYVCTLSAMVIKSATAHIFHAGDSRIYRLRGDVLEQLTEDHRVSVSAEKSYLSRALGMESAAGHRLPGRCRWNRANLSAGDRWRLRICGGQFHRSTTCKQHAARSRCGGQLIVARSVRARERPTTSRRRWCRVDALPTRDPNEIHQQLTGLPFPPMLEARMIFDGYRIVRELHASSRSHVYLAVDEEPTCRWSSKRRRSNCAATRPTWSDS